MKISKDLLKQMIAEEMANAGVVNEEDKCAAIRAKEDELHNLARHLEREGYYQYMQYYAEARDLREDNKECFPEYFKDKAPEPGKSGYDVTKKQYGLEEAQKKMVAEQMSEVFQTGITVQSPKEAHKYYVEALKDYKAVAGKIQQMLPEEQKEKGEEAIFETEYAIEKMMELVKFALENQGMSQQQKEEVRDKAGEIAYNDEYEVDAVKRILVLVNPTPEELEELVDELYRKYEVAEAYLMGILEGRYKEASDADLEDMGKQMGLGLQEESKKDMLKRIVAEEVVKMELEQLGKEGSLEEIFGLFGDGKLKMVEKEFIPKFRKGLAKRRKHHQDVPSHYWHYVIAEAIRRAYNEYQAPNSEYREATRKSKEWKKLGEEIDALVSDAYNLVKTNAMKSKTADAEDRKKMLSLDAYEADSGFKGTAKSYIP